MMGTIAFLFFSFPRFSRLGAESEISSDFQPEPLRERQRRYVTNRRRGGKNSYYPSRATGPTYYCWHIETNLPHLFNNTAPEIEAAKVSDRTGARRP